MIRIVRDPAAQDICKRQDYSQFIMSASSIPARCQLKITNPHFLIVFLIAAFSVFAVAQSPVPADPNSVPAIQLTRLFPNVTLRRPVQAVQAPGEPDNLYVVEQAGRVLRLDEKNDQVKSGDVFVDIRSQVNSKNNEEGLLSICFDPNYAVNGFLYMYYSADKPRRSILSRFHVSSDRKSVDVDSEIKILEVAQPYSNHNGGTALFGPDVRCQVNK